MSAVGSLVGSVVGSIRGSRAGTVAVPAGLGWAPSFAISQGAGRGYRPALNPASLKPSTSQTIYVATTGSDAADGSFATPKATIKGAVDVAGTKTVRVRAGTYYGGFAGGITVDTVIEPYGDGPVILTAQQAAQTWADAGSGAWSTTISNIDGLSQPYGVVDDLAADVYGAPGWLQPQASVAAVKASGGWFWAANLLTVKTADARQVTNATVHAYNGSYNGLTNNSTSAVLYVDGKGLLTFKGGNNPIYLNSAATGSTLVVLDTTILSAAKCGLRVDCAASVYAFRVRAMGAYGDSAAGFADGFNYFTTGAGTALEVDCIGLSNGSAYGADAGLSCNGSSAHAGQIIRCGGIYGGLSSVGPAIADVTSASSLNLGVRCVAVAGGTDPTNQRKSLVISGTGAAWVAGSLFEQGVISSSALHLRDTGATVTGAGTVDSW